MKRAATLSRISVLFALLALLCAFAPACGASASGEKAIKEAVRKHVEDNALWPRERVRVEFFGPMPEVAGLAGPLGGFGHERPSGLTGCGCHRWCTS